MPRVALLLLSMAFHAGAAAPDGKQGERMIMEALRASHPQVRRWEIAPLSDAAAASEAVASGIAGARVEVVRLGARSAIRIVTPTGHGTLRQKTIWYAVAGFQDAPTAPRPMTAGAALDPADVVIAEKDVIAAHCVPAAIDFSSAAGRWRTKVSLRQGKVICAADIEPSPPVERGRPVTVTYAGPTLTLSTRGIAQNDGGLGQRVSIKNTATREIFAAIVSGVAEVVIHE